MSHLGAALAIVMLVPTLAWAHSGGVDKYGCHNDKKAGDYHCHEGQLKDRSYKSQDTMLKAHPELRAADQADKKGAGERAKKEKAVDKVKDGDPKSTDEHLKESKDARK